MNNISKLPPVMGGDPVRNTEQITEYLFYLREQINFIIASTLRLEMQDISAGQRDEIDTQYQSAAGRISALESAVTELRNKANTETGKADDDIMPRIESLEQAVAALRDDVDLILSTLRI